MELCTESILKVIVPVVLILVQIPFFIVFVKCDWRSGACGLCGDSKL